MKKQLLILIYIVLTFNADAQTLSRTNVTGISLRGSGTIIQNEQVKGYYSFFSLEKKDKKNNNYQLSVYDENLREINSVNLTRSNSYILLDGVFNGSAFCLLFHDFKNKRNELISYDRSLSQLGTYTVENYTLSDLVLGGSQAYLIGIEQKGFLYYGMREDRYLYQTEFFDNSMNKIWSDMASEDANIEVASEAFQHDQYIGSLIVQKKSKSSKNIDVDLLVQNIADGKYLFRVPLVTDQYSVSFSNVYFDREKEQFIVFGEYYDRNQKELKTESLGFISISYDLEGKIVNEKVNSWATDISIKTPVNEKGKFDGSNTSVLFHDIIRTNDGQFFAVGEQYKKAGSGTGMALQALNILSAVFTGVYSTNPGSSVQMNIYNLVIFQFNPDFTINKVHIFEKDKNVVLLPSGAGFTSPKQLSFYVKAVGGFDYKYTQESSGKETFVVTYINYNREKGQKSTNMLGSVIYTPEKTFVVDKMALNRSSSDYFISRAKEGYVLVTEYFKKEKQLDSRLEKLNY